jgi:hypothetical protein
MGGLVIGLTGCLFGVQMEAIAPAEATFEPRGQVELRARRSGLVERATHQGRPLAIGDELSAGQSVVLLRAEETPHTEHRSSEFLDRRPTILAAPADDRRWLVLELPVVDGESARPGDLLAVLAPLDPVTGQVEMLARLEFEEADFGSVAVGQRLRLASPMYPSRLHGFATATVERLAPAAVLGSDSRPRFVAWACVTESPFPPRPGGTAKAEVLVGRKPTYRIILEH